MKYRICKHQERGELAKVITTYSIERLEKVKVGFWKPKEVEEWKPLEGHTNGDTIKFSTLKEAITVAKNLKEECLHWFLMEVVEEL